MGPVGRTTRRRLLGGELKRWREAAGLSVRQLAPLVHLKPGTISKIENGRQAILPRNVESILQKCGAPEEEVQRLVTIAKQEERARWWEPYEDIVPSWFADFVDLESDAESIQIYASELVDGSLQTPEYADAVARVTEPSFTEEQRRRGVELREARQARLLEPGGPRLHVVLNEGILRRPFGDDRIMRDQFRHLVAMSEHENFTIQVLPFSVGGHPAVKGTFTILRFPAGYSELDCVYIESETDGIWQDRPTDVERYTSVFARTAEMALAPEDTRTLLSNLAGQYPLREH